jgi:hypothetical protein
VAPLPSFPNKTRLRSNLTGFRCISGRFERHPVRRVTVREGALEEWPNSCALKPGDEPDVSDRRQWPSPRRCPLGANAWPGAPAL